MRLLASMNSGRRIVDEHQEAPRILADHDPDAQKPGT